jgi:hypothetical protein
MQTRKNTSPIFSTIHLISWQLTVSVVGAGWGVAAVAIGSLLDYFDQDMRVMFYSYAVVQVRFTSC